MLAVARAIAPEIRWREGRAEALPLEDGEQFDVVICHQGLQFFPDKPAAAREMRRALAPGGRVAVGTWRPLEEVPLFAALHAVAIRRLGPIHDQRHSYGDPTAISTLLRGAGFRNPQVEILTRALHFPDGEILVRLNAMALLSMSGAGKALSEDDRMELVGTLVREGWEAVAPFRDGVALTFDIASTVAVATC
jgi:SAM-dependent methyltransferase